MIGGFKMSKLMRSFALATLLLLSLLLAGCSSNVGVGLSVGIPVGNHGYISVGGSSNRWY
jgi:predicted small secreted protein